MKMPKIWEIIDKFKESCESHGWKTSKSEDWVETDNGYHNFLWSKGVHPSSFKRIASNRKCVIRKDLSYSVVQASYTAWLFSETPSRDLAKTIFENPDYSSKIALYDLSPLFEGKNLCAKLNNTDSPVFQKFENFLKTELKIKLKTVPPLTDSSINTDDCTIPELA